ncbi:MAG: anthranilate synthase component I [Lachnospiraceae bacterium]|nr:anthranilate synthase component I [Lachnospiraceae bacterium]
MMTMDQVQALIAEGGYGRIPLAREIYADIRTPIEVLRILKKVSRHCYLLESVEESKRWGRYTFLGFDPVLELTCTDGSLRIKSGSTIEQKVEHPGEAIRQILKENRSPRLPELPTFTGGLVGYFSYDYIKYAEPSLDLGKADADSFQDVDLMLFDKVIAFDHFRQKIILIVNMKTDAPEEEYHKAQLELEKLVYLLHHESPAPVQPLKLKSDFHPVFSKEAYCEMVEKGKQYIREGDIFQVVLSNQLEADMEGSLLDVYRVLRTSNPSPYMFYFSSDDIEIAGASPETLVKLEDGKLFTYPLAGTRPRGLTAAEDEALEKELLEDEKERAEHNMLVDLGRNDIGKISQIGSVNVEKYMAIERYSHVMHIGSTVSGQIRPECDGVDAVDAILPAGTLSGAPKLRACEIIHELEGGRRGIYGGAIGYLDFSGNLDVCIAIRIAYAKKGKIYARSGAGIVADSVPETEYEECLNKAKAVILAVKTAQEGMER